MAGAPGTFIKITGTGDVTYRLGGRAKYDLSQLASLAGSGPKTPMLRTLTAAVDATFSNSNGGSQTIDWQKLYDLIKRVQLSIQGHVFVDCQFTGGVALRIWNQLITGRLPEVNTNLTVAGSSTGTVQLKFIVPCFNPDAESPEDDLIPVGLLMGGSFELDWAPSGEFGANFTLTGATNIRSVTAEIVLRDETRVPAFWVLQERRQSALSDFIAPDGVLYTAIVLEEVNAQGQTHATISTSNLTTISLTQNGLKTIDALAPADAVTLWNEHQPFASEGYLPQPESGNLDFLPLQWNPRSSGKRTHMVPDLSKPYLQLTGTLAVSSCQLLLRYYKPNGAATVAQALSKMGVTPPDGFAQAPGKFLATKTSSKQPVAFAKGRFLPIKLYRGGAPSAS